MFSICLATGRGLAGAEGDRPQGHSLSFGCQCSRRLAPKAAVWTFVIIMMMPSADQASRLGRLANLFSFKHSSWNLPLQFLTYPLCIGLPGWMNCNRTPALSNHKNMELLVNSGPLSRTISSAERFHPPAPSAACPPTLPFRQLRLPAIERLLRNAVLAAHRIGWALTRLDLPQDADDLFSEKFAALHLSFHSCQFRGNSLSAWTGILGGGQTGKALYVSHGRRHPLPY